MLVETETILKEKHPALLDVFQQIDELRDSCLKNKHWTDGEWLSQAQTKLANLNAYMGEYVAVAKYDADTFKENAEGLEAAYKRTEMEKIDSKTDKLTTAAKAEVIAKEKTENEYEVARRARYYYNLTKIKSDSTSELITSISVRLAWMKSSRTEIKVT